MKQVWRIVYMIPVLLVLSACGSVVATSGQVTFTDNTVRAGIVFSATDREIISRYYANLHPGRGKGHGKKTPPGLAKRGTLPPGLARRDVLPKGLRGRGLPVGLESQLRPLPEPYVRLVIGTDIVIINRHTRVMMDILRGVIP